MRHPFPSRLRAAFTLVELLVVIGIIAMLIGVLLPALNRARASANIVKCLSNIRQLGMATTMYIGENKGRLPEAMYNNRGAWSPRRIGAAPWNVVPAGHPTNSFGANAMVLPTIGELLNPYLGEPEGRKVWECPTGDVGPDSYSIKGPNPITGFAAEDDWLPNYFYFNTKVYYGQGYANPSVAAGRVKPGFPGGDWLVRSVGGLTAGSLRSASRQGSSEIVIFTEYKSFFHTPSRTDIYNLPAGQKTKYAGNFAYLDGHAETHRYEDRDGYVKVLHDPIPQTWYGRNFTVTYPEFYNPATFYR
ncbi:MAG TPA: type II secretion system protein [Tepidisphaeraceae bacterium]|jgi:prepilin-type processing-associated H-X9-DG protein